MLQQLNLHSENEKVFAFRLEGKLRTEDVIRSISEITPALEAPAALNMYVEVVSLEGIEPEALKERIKFAFYNYRKILDKVDRLALVTDIDWMRTAAQFIYDLIPGIEMKAYTFDEAAKARQWIAE